MDTSLYKLARLYVDHPLANNQEIILGKEHSHYLGNVLRKNKGDEVRLFNGKDGEWLCEITSIAKRELVLIGLSCTRKQPENREEKHLYFAPLKKQRLDFLIEKSVELGVTKLIPVLTRNTENRHLKEERVRLQIIEAAEQCERLDIPELADSIKLSEMRNIKTPIMAALERDGEAEHISKVKLNAVLIGPEGGFTEDEIQLLKDMDTATPVNLGETILRAETAALYALAHMKT